MAESYIDIAKYAVKECLGKTKFTYKKYLKSGVFGNVFIACEGNNCSYVVKIIKFKPTNPFKYSHNHFEKEVNMSIKTADLGISPKVHYSGICTKDGIEWGVLIMDKIEGTTYINTKLTSDDIYEIFSMFLTLYEETGYFNLDNVDSNLIKDEESGKWFMIDYGKLSKPDDDEEFEEKIVEVVEELMSSSFQFDFNKNKNMKSLTKKERVTFMVSSINKIYSLLDDHGYSIDTPLLTVEYNQVNLKHKPHKLYHGVSKLKKEGRITIED